MKNVILFTIDALRWDVFGSYRSCETLTPFLDSMAKQSIVFTQCHSVAPYTQASFLGILTSSYLFDHPRSQKLSSGRTFISEVLHAKGIVTAAFHSNPYLSGYFGWNRGWDQFYDSMEDEVDDISPYIKGDVINGKVDEWFSSHLSADKYRPFFLWLHYMDVHEPYVPDRRYVDLVDSSINLSQQEMFRLFKEVLLKRNTSDAQTVQLLNQLYKCHVREIDEYAKSFFDILEKYGILKNSLVIITTDHGDEFAEHGGLSHDGKMYSELVHVPFMIYDGSKPQGKICDTLVSGLDLSPTVLHLFDLEPHPNFQGVSLLPLKAYPQKGCYGEAIGKLSHKIKETDRPAYYYREKNLKIMYREEDDRWEIYDLSTDPSENANIIDTSPSVDVMKEKLKPRINRKTKSE